MWTTEPKKEAFAFWYGGWKILHKLVKSIVAKRFLNVDACAAEVEKGLSSLKPQGQCMVNGSMPEG